MARPLLFLARTGAWDRISLFLGDPEAPDRPDDMTITSEIFELALRGAAYSVIDQALSMDSSLANTPVTGKKIDPLLLVIQSVGLQSITRRDSVISNPRRSSIAAEPGMTRPRGSTVTGDAGVPVYRYEHVAMLLLAHGADPNAKDSKGNAALVLACQWKLKSLALTLLATPNIDHNVSATNGLTARELAITAGVMPVVAIIDSRSQRSSSNTTTPQDIGKVTSTSSGGVTSGKGSGRGDGNGNKSDDSSDELDVALASEQQTKIDVTVESLDSQDARQLQHRIDALEVSLQIVTEEATQAKREAQYADEMRVRSERKLKDLEKKHARCAGSDGAGGSSSAAPTPVEPSNVRLVGCLKEWHILSPQEAVNLGSDTGKQKITVRGDGISKKHSIIDFSPSLKRFQITNLSKYGMRVNDLLLDQGEAILLTDMSRIEIGSKLFSFQYLYEG